MKVRAGDAVDSTIKLPGNQELVGNGFSRRIAVLLWFWSLSILAIVTVLGSGCARGTAKSDIGLAEKPYLQAAPSLVAKGVHIHEFEQGGRTASRIAEHPEGTVVNAPVAYQRASARVLVPQEDRIVAYSAKNEPEVVFDLSRSSMVGLEASRSYKIVWNLETRGDRATFAVISDKSSQQAFCIVDLDTDSGQCVQLRWAPDATFDFSTDTLYHSSNESRRTVVKRTPGEKPRKVVTTSHAVAHLDINSETGNLLVSTWGEPEDSGSQTAGGELFVYDPATREKQVIHRSSFARGSWLEESQVVYATATNTLMLADLESGEKSLLLEIGDEPVREHNPRPPSVGHGGRFIGWQWRACIDGASDLGVVTIDLLKKHFSMIDQFAMHLAWAN